MPNFVLVHGAWTGAWVWERVVEHLSSGDDSGDAGKVMALDLPGHGRRSVDEIRRITVEHYVQAVTTPVEVERLDDVVLVGHGFAGTILPRVATYLGSKVRRVIFLAGELPPEGKSPYNRLSRRDKLMLRLVRAQENGFRFPDMIFKRLLCQGLDRETARGVLARLVPDPFLPWLTPVSREGFPGDIPTTYVTLSGDRVVPRRLQRVYAHSLGTPDVQELAAGHGALLSHPQEVAACILKATS